jgi:hypothetical protein
MMVCLVKSKKLLAIAKTQAQIMELWKRKNGIYYGYKKLNDTGPKVVFTKLHKTILR